MIDTKVNRKQFYFSKLNTDCKSNNDAKAQRDLLVFNLSKDNDVLDVKTFSFKGQETNVSKSSFNLYVVDVFFK